jgi:hypothetical protein
MSYATDVRSYIVLKQLDADGIGRNHRAPCAEP